MVIPPCVIQKPVAAKLVVKATTLKFVRCRLQTVLVVAPVQTFGDATRSNGSHDDVLPCRILLLLASFLLLLTKVLVRTCLSSFARRSSAIRVGVATSQMTHRARLQHLRCRFLHQSEFSKRKKPTTSGSISLYDNTKIIHIRSRNI